MEGHPIKIFVYKITNGPWQDADHIYAVLLINFLLVVYIRSTQCVTKDSFYADSSDNYLVVHITNN